MTTIAPTAVVPPAPPVPPSPAPSEPSAYGGVLVLAQAWARSGGSALCGAGIRWQGQAGALLLFALVALPLLGCASVEAVAQRCARRADPLWRVLGWARPLTQRRLARFASSPRHDWLAVLGAMARLLAHHPATALGGTGIVAVDSTTVEKRYGPRLPGRRPVYDAVQARLVDGYEVVSACAVGPRRAWPIGLVPHAKGAGAPKRRRRKAASGEPPSKLEVALELVTLAVRMGVGAPTVVGDSAFAVQWWLGEIAALGRHWLVSTRQDRRLRIGAEIRGFRAWAGTVALACVERDARGGGVWGGLLPEAILLDRHCRRQGLPCRPAYLERRDRQGRVRHRWYLVTSQRAWDLPTLWRHWQWRWQIEVWHRESKQHLPLEAFHGRSWAGIVALIACCSLRASLLVFLQAVDPRCAGLSTGALIDALREAACQVEGAPGERAQVSLPPNLPATALWQSTGCPVPAEWWPVALKAA